MKVSLILLVVLSGMEALGNRKGEIMIYLKVLWNHDFPDEPYVFYVELDNKRFQNRMLELYRDGKIAYATRKKEYNSFLADEPYPTIEDINSDTTKEFIAANITKDDFEKIWIEKAGAEID